MREARITWKSRSESGKPASDVPTGTLFYGKIGSFQGLFFMDSNRRIYLMTDLIHYWSEPHGFEIMDYELVKLV